MSAQRFSVGTQFSWQGQAYEIRRLLPGSKLSLVTLPTNEMHLVTFEQLYQALLAGQLQFQVDQQPLERLNKSGYIDLSDCPESLRAVAEYRLKLIQPLLKIPRHQRKQAIQTLVEALHTQAQGPRSLQSVVSTASIYRWLSDYTKSGQDIRVLIPGLHRRGGKQQSRLKPDVEALIHGTLADLGQALETKSLDYAHREIAVRLAEENQHRLPEERLAMPARTTIRRRIKAVAGQDKQAQYPATRDSKQYEAMNYPLMPLTRVEIDHTRSDLMVIDETDYLPLGRLTLTYCLDTATRYPLGYYLGFEPPSYLAVMACLYHTILPKENVPERYGTQHNWLAYGIPFTLVVDNGKEFIGHDLDDACYLLGIMLERMPVRTPHFKAAVERMFGTTNTGLLHTLPGTTFAHLGQRGQADRLKQACISLNELDRMMHIFLLDIYAEDFHRGLEGIPARQWAAVTQAGFFPRVPASATELQILLGRVAYRTIQPYGIELYSLRYNCAELISLRTRMKQRDPSQIKIKYHPADLSRIYAYDPDEARYLEVPALAQEYTQGLSLWKHRVIRNFVLNEQHSVDIVALGYAQRKIQAIIEASLQRQKLSTRAKIARWQQSDPLVDPPAAAESKTRDQITDDKIPALSGGELDLKGLDEEGWGLSYDLPGTQGGKSDDH
jgi:putative transposase